MSKLRQPWMIVGVGVVGFAFLATFVAAQGCSGSSSYSRKKKAKPKKQMAQKTPGEQKAMPDKPTEPEEAPPPKRKKRPRPKLTPRKVDLATVDLSKKFSHDSHAHQLRFEGDRLLSCNDCHVLDSFTDPKVNPICETTRMPFPTHDKCTKCHAKAFRTFPLVVCTNCHTKNSIEEAPPLKTVGQRALLHPVFSHKLHLSANGRVRKRFKKEAACQSCHIFENGGEKVLLPNHAQCCECHTDQHVEPHINDCQGCHADNKDFVRKTSVQHFSHADHSLDPKSGETLDCQQCHKTTRFATELAEVRTPKMATCITCHSGEVAFDYIKCLKCHGPGIENKPLPEGHPK